MVYGGVECAYREVFGLGLFIGAILTTWWWVIWDVWAEGKREKGGKSIKRGFC